jgi:hypothetical protein
VKQEMRFTMAEYPSQFSSREAELTLEFIPVEEEDGDFDTLICMEKIYTEVQSESTQREDITIKSLPTNERGVDFLILISLIGTTIVASKDLLTSIFNMITATVELLAKKDHVQEIEIIANGKTVILRDLNNKTAKEILEALASLHPEASEASVPGNTVRVKAKVSKKNKARN